MPYPWTMSWPSHGHVFQFFRLFTAVCGYVVSAASCGRFWDLKGLRHHLWARLHVMTATSPLLTKTRVPRRLCSDVPGMCQRPRLFAGESKA